MYSIKLREFNGVINTFLSLDRLINNISTIKLMNQSFLVEKQNIYQVNQRSLAKNELSDGEIRFKIQKYALTSNNITYAVSGFQLKYWDFFPVDKMSGIIPVWGYGEVVDSKNNSVKIGERYYGYFPMSDFLTVLPVNINSFGFSDGAEHRQKLSPIYNHYSRIAADSTFNKQTENYIPIIKPLFATSFLIYHYLKNENFLDAEQIILTSASSKTGMALAFMLKHNKKIDNKKIIGLTSTRNIDFVKSTDYYDEVIAYDKINGLQNIPSFIVDFAGNFKSLITLSDNLSDNLKHITLVGLTDWKGVGTFNKIPKSKFFFAPTHIQRMYKNKGVEQTNIELNKSLVAFINDTKSFIELEFINNFSTLKQLYLDMVDGKVDPKKGYIIQI